MRHAWWLVVIAGCSFDPPVGGLPAAIDADASPPTDVPPDQAPAACPNPPAGCGLFECPFSSSCYYICAEDRTWTSARDECVAADLGCLATIDDADENACILTNAAPGFPDFVWFGFVQPAGAGEPASDWGWACGTSSFRAGNWGQFEPNNGGNEDCAGMVGDGGWIDAGCNSTARYLCERPR